MRKSLTMLAGALTALCLGAGPAAAEGPVCGGRAAPATHSAPRPAQTRGDIVDVARSAGQFNTLLAAAQAAGLVEALRGEGPLTVFAPTDAAFAALPHGTIERLLRPESREELRALLAYHVVAGRVASDQLAGRTLAPVTLNGAILAIDGRQGVTVNEATVIAADVAADNGVIHVIDAVLAPF